MRKISLFFGLVVLLVYPASLPAAEIVGTWHADSAGRRGTVKVKLTFGREGGILTGKMESPDSETADLKEIKVEGGKVSFSIRRDVRGMSMKEIWKGEFSSNDVIRFKRSFEIGGGFGRGSQGGGGNAEDEIVAKRVNRSR
jgi:hypothetical protein